MRWLVLPLLVFPALLQAAGQGLPEAGDCARFREGGDGYVLATPTYYVEGTIAEVYSRRHRMELCPAAGKPRERYTRADWRRYADAYPCAADPASVREVETLRVRMRVDRWETPWTRSHGQNGWLFSGHFLDTELKEGVVLDIDGMLLERCDAGK